jgi:replicative DNA helicase
MASDQETLEISVLAGVSNDRYLLSKAVEEGFRADLFFSPAARIVAAALLRLRNQPGGVVDPLVLKGKLEAGGLLTPQVAECLDALRATPAPQLDQLLSYLEMLKDRESRARLLRLAREMVGYARAESPAEVPLMDFTARVLQEVVTIHRERVRKRVTSIGSMVEQILSESKARPKGEQALLGYSLRPFERLTRVLSGLRRGFYYGLAGAPRRGKTTLALHLAASLAEHHHIPVLFYSWEQTRKVLTARLIAKAAGVNPASLLSRNLENLASGSQQFTQGLSRLRTFEDTLFVLEGTRQDTLERIRATAYNVMHEFRTDSIAIFLDYLQKVPLAKPPDDLRARIDQISTELADLSLELNCPVLAITALDKEGCRLDDGPTGEAKYDELRIRPRPTIHHCTGGGDIEYDLDVAMVLSKDWSATHQLEDLLKTQEPSKRLASKVDILDLYIDKSRDAPGESIEAIQYAFFVYENRLVELDYKREEQEQKDFRGFSYIRKIFENLAEEPKASAAGN